MASIFDLQDNLSQPGLSGYDTFQQRLAAQRALLEQTRPDIASQMPTLGAATPGQQVYQAAEQQPAQDLGQTVSQISQGLAQGATPEGAKPKDAMASQQGIEQILSYLNPLKPKETYGPNIGKSLGMGDNAGGILGLGVQPIDVLAFALGAAVTRNMPQDKAIATTMHLAGLPKAFRDSQEANARKFIDDQVNAVNSQLTQGNLVQRQLENAFKLKQVADRDKLISELTARLGTGKPLDPIEKAQYMARASKLFDSETVKQLFTRGDPQTVLSTIQQIRQGATAMGMPEVSATVPIEGGGNITVGKSSGSQDVSQRTREILAASREAGKPLTIAEAHQKALSEEVTLAGNKAGAVAQNTPLPAAVQNQLVQKETVASALAQIRQNFNKDFVGPLAGRFFEARRQGVGTTPSEQEVNFRLALNDAGDLILRARSGAQINENEADRLKALLPKATDTDKVFMSALNRFESEFNKALGVTRSLASTPKKDVEAANRPVTPPAGAKIRDYSTLK